MNRTDDYVWHFVLHRAGQPKERGERLATVSLPPAEIARLGLPAVRKAVDAARLEWQRVAIAAGYVDGWGVSTVPERGYRRSLFPVPAAIVPAATIPAIPGGRTDA